MAVKDRDEHECVPRTPEECLDRAIETAVDRAIFGGNDLARRRFLQLVGSSSAAVLIGSVFPLDTAKAIAQEQVKGIEKKDLVVSFIPLPAATRIIMAETMAFYATPDCHGTVRQDSGSAVVRYWAVN